MAQVVERTVADAEVARALGLGPDGKPGGEGARRHPVLRLGVGILLALGMVAAVVLWRRTRGEAEPAYEVLSARLGPLEVTVTATGTLEPVTSVQVGSEVSGPIRRVFVDFNDRVARGQRLAELDTERLEARAGEAEASLAAALAGIDQAEAGAVEAREQAGRAQALAGANLLSRQELEAALAAEGRAEAALRAARAQATLARASRSAARTELAKAVIRSPIDGIVIERNVEPGQTVAAAFQTPVLFTLAGDLARMELHADIDEADVGRVREGHPATFSVDAYPDRRFPARLTALHHAPRIVQGVVTYEAVLAVDNAEQRLQPGMTATVVIATDRRERALLVPNAALRFVPPEASAAAPLPAGRQRVWTLQDGSPAPLLVTTGLSDGRVTEVLTGPLAPGTPLLVGIREEARR